MDIINLHRSGIKKASDHQLAQFCTFKVPIERLDNVEYLINELARRLETVTAEYKTAVNDMEKMVKTINIQEMAIDHKRRKIEELEQSNRALTEI